MYVSRCYSFKRGEGTWAGRQKQGARTGQATHSPTCQKASLCPRRQQTNVDALPIFTPRHCPLFASLLPDHNKQTNKPPRAQRLEKKGQPSPSNPQLTRLGRPPNPDPPSVPTFPNYIIMEHNQSASRAARRFLDDRVRTDWDWPTPPPCWSASDEEVRGVTVFRERFYGDSSPSSSSDSDDEATENATASAAHPYKFDNPDSIGGMVERKAERKKRKREEQLRSEMLENEGLRIFVARRDRWTGADAVRKYGTNHTPKQPASANNNTAPRDRDETANSPAAAAADEHDDKTTVIPDPTTPGDSPLASPSPTPTTPTTTVPSIPPLATPILPSVSNTPPPPSPPLTTALIPLAPRLLATNSIRASISQRTYPDIYSKIVLQSRTPAVPINLADMSKALVQGWRDTGEWPPKQAPLDPLAGGKRRGLGFGLGFGLGGGRGGGRGDARAAARGVNGAAHSGSATEGGDAFLAHHPHLQKGVGGLKRMLHLNGGGGGGGSSSAQTASLPVTPPAAAAVTGAENGKTGGAGGPDAAPAG